jgi:hypothetical protein
MKKINRVTLLSFLSLVILTAFNTPALAGGGYNPYGPHIPEETGIADAKIFIIAAIIVYTVGLVLIATSKFIKNKAE